MKRFTLILALLLAVTSFTFAQKSPADRITPALKAELEKRKGADEQFRIIIGMADKYDQAQMSRQTQYLKGDQRREFVVDELSRFSAASQADLLKTLNEGKKANIVKDVQSFWIFNGVSCVTTREMIYALSERPDIAYIESDELRNMLPESNLINKGKFNNGGSAQAVQTNRDGAKSIAWNVTQVHANEVWNYSVGGNNIKGDGVVVAVIDTGLDYYHPDIISHLWQPTPGSAVDTLGTFTVGTTTYKHPGYDFVTPDNDPIDDNGHGSHCAGTVAGNGTSGIQTGMAPEAKIMALKVLSAAGSGSTSAITAAMQFAIKNGANVISMSLGGHETWLGHVLQIDSNTSYREAFNSVLDAGIVGVVAAGNEGEQYALALNSTHYDVPKNIGSPGNCPAPWTHPDQTLKGGNSGCITIGASNRNDRKATFSSFGPVSWKSSSLSSYFVNSFDDYDWDDDGDPMGLIKPDVLVPGTDITSMYYKYQNPYYYDINNDPHYSNHDANVSDTMYYAECGTSMATPGAAGIVALMIQARKEKDGHKMTPAEIDEILELSALPVDFRTTKNNNTGAGRADARAAVDAILTTATKPTDFQITNLQENTNIVKNGGCVHLSWTPSTSAPAGYVIYRDNEPVGTIVTAQVSTVTVNGKITYKDEDPGVGLHTYYVRANDNNGYQSLHSNAVVCEVKPYATAKDLSVTWAEGSSATVGTATLGWEPKIGSNVGQTEKTTLHYTDVTHTAFTNNMLQTGYWGMRFTPEDLAPYLGMRIDSISLYIYKSGLTGAGLTDNIHVRLYRGTLNGNTAETKVFDRTCHVSNVAGWKKVKLDLYNKTLGNLDSGDEGGYLIDDITQDLWITFADVINSTLLGSLQEYPIGVGEYDGPNSNCFYMGSTNTGVNGNDVVWSHIPDFGDAYNYAVSAVAYLNRVTTYNASYKVDFDNPGDATALANLQESQSGGGYTNANRTLTSGENIYYVTAKAQAQTGNTLGTTYTSCPQEAKIVMVDGTYSETSPYVDIDQTKVYLVQSNGVITSDGITCTDPTRLIIEDGGQVFTSSTNVQGKVKKNIPAFSDGTNGGWQFIASPASSNLSASDVANLINDNNEQYGLYYYDEPTHYWVNYENGNNNIEPQKGYLYSNLAGLPIAFAGPLQPNNAEISVPLSYSETHPNSEPNVHPGWNLVGNPFPSKAYTNKSYYVTTYNYPDGVDPENPGDAKRTTKLAKHVASSNIPIAPCTGIMVQATATDKSVLFNKSSYNVEPTNKGTVRIAVAHTVLSRGDVSETPADDAIVSFNAGDELEKFVFDADDARLYIPQGNKEYAIAVSELEGEVPVNFVAAENGSYTLNVKPENVEFTYLHLIDNKTGVDTDLLATPNYTFNASVTDYESRFRLLFSTDEANEDADDDIFAFFNGSVWVISNDDDATLQVVDVMGRVLHSKDGARTLSTSDLASGVYTLRLVNGENVRTQKIVVR